MPENIYETFQIFRYGNLPVMKAYFLAWVMEGAFGFLMFAILFGQVAYPQWKAISTTGWDAYSLLLWGFLPFIALAAFTMRMIDSAKMGYVRPF